MLPTPAAATRPRVGDVLRYTLASGVKHEVPITYTKGGYVCVRWRDDRPGMDRRTAWFYGRWMTEVPRQGVVRRTAESVSSPGTHYTFWINPLDGSRHCTCPGYYRWKRCKHMTALMAETIEAEPVQGGPTVWEL